VSTGQHMYQDPRAWENWEAPPGVPDKGLLDLLAEDAAGRATALLAGSTTVTDDPLIAPNVDQVVECLEEIRQTPEL